MKRDSAYVTEPPFQKATRSIGGQESPRDFAILLIGNFALAFGPLLVRWSDSGPTAAAFWRMSLALPLLCIVAWRWGKLGDFIKRPNFATDSYQLDSSVQSSRLGAMLKSKRSLALPLAILAGVLFAFDLASWHIGIVQTKLANASLFGNSASLFLVGITLSIARTLPRPAQMVGIGLAFPGAMLLLAQSYEMSPQYFIGDLLCLLAGVFYCCYLLVIKRAQRWLDNWSALFFCSLTSVPVLLGIALFLDEKIWPNEWGALIALTVSSQMIGQGCMVYALPRISTLIVGLSLLAQPAVGILVGWIWFGEFLSLIDWIGAGMVASALVLIRLPERASKSIPKLASKSDQES